MAGPGYRTRGGNLELTKPIKLDGADEKLPVDVAEGVDDEATLAALIAALGDAGIINFIPNE
jgi:hypothetical protein